MYQSKFGTFSFYNYIQFFKDINDVEKQIRIIGINQNYSNNIISYMKSLSLSREELLVIEKDCTEVINLIDGKSFISDLSLSF